MRTRAPALALSALLLLSSVGRRADEANPAIVALPPRLASVGEDAALVPRPDAHAGVLVRPTVRPLPTGAAPSRPTVRLPDNPPVVTRVQPTGNSSGSASIRGLASWYCGPNSRCTRGYPGGLYAAAGPLLRVGQWRGRLVRVTYSGRSVTVRLIDWCACPKRALDLYSDAFQRLAPLSRGLLNVTVTW